MILLMRIWTLMLDDFLKISLFLLFLLLSNFKDLIKQYTNSVFKNKIKNLTSCEIINIQNINLYNLFPFL